MTDERVCTGCDIYPFCSYSFLFFFISEIRFYSFTHAYEIALVAIRVVGSCFFVTTTAIEQSSKQRRNKKKQVRGLALLPKNILLLLLLLLSFFF